MEPVIIKSTPKTHQFGYFNGAGEFVGVTIKGTDLVYDESTGLLVGGTVRWIEYDNDGSIVEGYSPQAPVGHFVLRDLDETDVATLNTAGFPWSEPIGFFELFATQQAPSLTMDRTWNGIRGGAGDDLLTLENDSYYGYSKLDGGEGDDTVQGGAWSDTLLGSEGNDQLYGGGGDDLMSGGADDDRLYGGSGDDSLQGNGGADYIAGGTGDDTMFGDRVDFFDLENPDAGDDVLIGGAGNDTIFGHAGNDRLRGDDGRDTIHGGQGDDRIYGGEGADELFGDDNQFVFAGNDRIYGGAGDDFLFAGGGSDRMYGGSGNDVLFLDAGDDLARGDAGDDVLSSVRGGNDVLIGGAGADTFQFHVATTETSQIRDFAASEDILSLVLDVGTTQQEQFDLFMSGATQLNQHVVWTNGDMTIQLNRTSIDEITLDNFVDTVGWVIAEY